MALYDIDADAVAARVLSCPAVAGLSGGPFGAAATYLPGRKVPGVQITPGAVAIHVVARYGIPLPELARQVRQVLTGQVLGRVVDIVVEDLADPPAATSLAPAPVADGHAHGASAAAPGVVRPLVPMPPPVGPR